jgi:hypothetical protein
MGSVPQSLLQIKMQTSPINIGKRWTHAEESLLLSESTSGVPIAQIALSHGRKVGGIRSRLLRIACVYMSEGKTLSEASRLTGLRVQAISAHKQTSEKTDSACAVPPAVSYKMQFTKTFSRADLQAIPAKRRLEAIQGYVENYQIYQSVYNAAAAGKTSYLHVIPKTGSMGSCYPPPYIVTPDDIVEGLRAKFPDCDVVHSEEWVDVRPGVREHRKGILIDWSPTPLSAQYHPPSTIKI